MSNGYSSGSPSTRPHSWCVYLLCLVVAIAGCRKTPRTEGDSGAPPRVSANAPADSARAIAEDDSTASTTPAEVVRRYYDAIRAGSYDSAYALWEGAGQASHQTRAQFASGFARTADVHATIGDSVRIEGAAGSQYATVPVVVDAVLRDGQRQHFEGTYVLRRSLVDGATPAQRHWHIYSAHLTAR